jgi:hypothetical protein
LRGVLREKKARVFSLLEAGLTLPKFNVTATVL